MQDDSFDIENGAGGSVLGVCSGLFREKTVTDDYTNVAGDCGD